MGMISIIKKAGIDAVGTSKPVNVLFGEVLDAEELKIKVDQKLILDREFFIIPKNLTRYEIDLKHEHTWATGSTSDALSKIIIREGLNQGDKVLLLRIQGGQQYLILDKVV